MSEQSEAKRDGARLQRNSGRGQYSKGDATTDYFLIDYKEAEKSFTLNRKVWSKVVTDTLRVDPDRMPVLKVIMGVDNKIRLAVVEWALIEEYEGLRDEVEELRQSLKDTKADYNAIKAKYDDIKWRMDGLEK